MNDWLGQSVRVCVLVTTVGLLPLFATVGQVDLGRITSADLTTWAPSRTPWGDPDLQGVWNNTVNTPLERPADLVGQEFLTEEEVAAQEARREDSQHTHGVDYGSPGWKGARVDAGSAAA